jgi:hypothetical protein
VRRQARKQFRIWLKNPQHPSLHFKPVGSYWSARVNRDIRVLGIRRNDEIVWFYIGAHESGWRLNVFVMGPTVMGTAVRGSTGHIVNLPERVRNADYIRHPVPQDMIVPEKY